MIIENTGYKGSKCELGFLDEVMDKAEFVRWQWEFYRATYDYQIDGESDADTYYLRVNTRVVEGKLENPSTVLVIEDTYIGKASFPHGVDYNAPIPDAVMKTANQKIAQLKQQLA